MNTRPYPSYKDSVVGWIGEVPEHWEIKRLGQYFNQRREKVSDKDFAALSVTKNGIVPQLDTAAKTDDGDNRKKVCINDFVINSRSDRKGSSGLSELEGSVSLIATVLEPRGMYPKYVHHLFKSYLFQEEFYRFGRGIVADLWSTNYSEMKNINIPIPNSIEQTAIANFLDRETSRIDSLIKEKENFIKLLQEKRQALISHAVTKGFELDAREVPDHWENYRIDWISTIIRGNTGFRKDELLDSGEYVALQYGKTYKVDEVSDTFNFFVNSEFYKFSQVVHHGDTILISTSETVEDLGHSCFYNRSHLGLIGGEQILLKPNSKLVYEKYLYYSSKVFCGELKKYATGLKVFRFNIDDLKKIFISIPSVEEQEAIANFLDSETTRIDSLIEEVKHSIDLLKEHRSALISAAVTGKIDVRNQYTTKRKLNVIPS